MFVTRRAVCVIPTRVIYKFHLRRPTTVTYTSASRARPSAIRISSCDTAVAACIAPPVKESRIVVRWAETRRWSFTSRSWDRPRCRIAAAKPRASFTRRTRFTPATRCVSRMICYIWFPSLFCFFQIEKKKKNRKNNWKCFVNSGRRGGSGLEE